MCVCFLADVTFFKTWSYIWAVQQGNRNGSRWLCAIHLQCGRTWVKYYNQNQKRSRILLGAHIDIWSQNRLDVSLTLTWDVFVSDAVDKTWKAFDIFQALHSGKTIFKLTTVTFASRRSRYKLKCRTFLSLNYWEYKAQASAIILVCNDQIDSAIWLSSSRRSSEKVGFLSFSYGGLICSFRQWDGGKEEIQRVKWVIMTSVMSHNEAFYLCFILGRVRSSPMAWIMIEQM